MTALAKIREAGFTVLLDGDALKIRPAADLTDLQRAFLKTNKAELLAELRQEQEPAEPAEPAAQDKKPCNRSELLALLDGDPSVAPAVRLLGTKQVARVKCADCRHFVRDTIGDGSGIGDCAINANDGRMPPSERYPVGFPTDYPLYPLALRLCAKFVPGAIQEPKTERS